MSLTVDKLIDKLDANALLMRPLSDWRAPLSNECGVYVFGENYIAKRFDQINYKFCDKASAKDILVDNLYALLRYKYFPKSTEEIDERINKIVSSFTANLKTTLKKVSFDTSSDCEVIKMLPDYCIAFRNGVWDFKHDKWLFQYTMIRLERISNRIYIYPPEYCIMWYLDYDFESLGVKIEDLPLKDFVNFMKDLTKMPGSRNYCFELMYNIAHDRLNTFSLKRFEHLCEVLGYTMLQSFSQYFVMLIGSGQNGKNSLFDGCFTNRLIPRAASNDLDAIENDRFITGALENRSHNIFLETSAKTYTESKMIKALTGSMYQTIEQKGVSKYSSVINCKYVFAGNDQDKIKFTDTTTGFKRRINMFEIFYQWDSKKTFLTRGDYYDTSFSDSLVELKDDPLNTTAFVYFAMYGILSGTKKFTKNFQFTMNDWNDKYFDIDIDLKEKINSITCEDIGDFMSKSEDRLKDCASMWYTASKSRLQNSSIMANYEVDSMLTLVRFFRSQEETTSFFADYDVYLSLRHLQLLIGKPIAAREFTNEIKRIYNPTIEPIYNNKSYVRCTFVNGRLKIK